MDQNSNEPPRSVLEYEIPQIKPTGLPLIIRFAIGILLGVVALFILVSITGLIHKNPDESMILVLVFHICIGLLMMISNKLRAYGVGFLCGIPVVFLLAVIFIRPD